MIIGIVKAMGLKGFGSGEKVVNLQAGETRILGDDLALRRNTHHLRDECVPLSVSVYDTSAPRGTGRLIVVPVPHLSGNDVKLLTELPPPALIADARPVDAVSKKRTISLARARRRDGGNEAHEDSHAGEEGHVVCHHEVR
jgi:hypothetical protein